MANINKNIIMQAGAAVANATNKAAGLSAATPEPGSIISAIQLVNGGRTIGPDALAHFTESVRNKLLSLLVSLEPIQDFNGYGHPWPAGGGKNLYNSDNFIFNGSPTITTKNGITLTRDNGKLAISGTATAETRFDVGYAGTFKSGNTYTISVRGLTNGAIRIIMNGTPGGHGLDYKSELPTSDFFFTFTVDADVVFQYFFLDVQNGATINNIVSIQIEEGSTATAWTPYSNICPISGRTGANAYVSPTPNVADATTYSADWTTPAGTVYAGSADIVTGDIKAAPYYASYNGETLVGPWVSSMDVYNPEGTPTTGAQVVDLGGALTEYHITGQDIITLVGDNYIWSDSGDVTITE